MTPTNGIKCNPIFLVGAPRSGTTLLAAIFSAHRDFACGPETQFFSQLDDNTLKIIAEDPLWPTEAVRYLLQLELSGAPVVDLFAITKTELFKYLKERPPSTQVLLESLTELFSKQKSKPCWVEKTPNHILHVNRIRNLYPTASIIRIVRDPRDSALSMGDLPWTSNSFICNCHLWNEWYNMSNSFFESDKYSYTIRYEDLVLHPRSTLIDLCKAIGIPFDNNMLEHERSAQNVIPGNEPWKEGVRSPIYSSRVEAWRKKLSPTLSHAGSLICHKAIVEFGYPEPRQPIIEYAFTYFDREYIEKNEKDLIGLAGEYVLIKIATPDESCSQVLNQLNLQGNSSLERIKNTIKFILKTRASRNGCPIRFIPKPAIDGFCEKVCYLALSKWGYPVEITSGNHII